MAHKAQHNFFERVKAQFPEYFKGKTVLDCGSLDVNGTLKDLFEDCEYTGVDCKPGKNVDFVSLVHKLGRWSVFPEGAPVPFSDEYFDTIVSAEMLEHDEHWDKSIRRMIEMLKPGGLLVISCATTGRDPHGVGGEGEDWATTKGYYRNITAYDIIKPCDGILTWHCEENPVDHDLYFVGVKWQQSPIDHTRQWVALEANKPKCVSAPIGEKKPTKEQLTAETVERLKDKLSLPYTKLDLGCGLARHAPYEEWIFLDGDSAQGIDIVCDWTEIPLHSESINEVWTGETIEHIPKWNIDKTLKEWNRVIKMGGVLGLTTPNLEYVCHAFVKGEKDMDWILSNLYGDRHSAPHQHYTLYTKQTLEALLNQYGFEVTEWKTAWGEHSKDWQWLSCVCKKVK